MGNPRVAREAENLEKMKTPPQKHRKKMILNFDATFAKAAAVNLMATALGNQKTPLLNHVSEKAATIQNASQRMLPVNPRVVLEAENLAKMKTPAATIQNVSRRMLPVNPRVARETANLEKLKTPPQKHPKMILNFDATFAKATDVEAAVNLMATALGNQKTPLLNHVMIAKIAENVKIVVILTTHLMN